MKNKTEIKPEAGKRLKELREKEKYSQARLAKEANCSIQLISGIENGKRPLTTDMAKIFAEILCSDEDYLMGNKDYQLIDLLPKIYSKTMFSQFKVLPTVCLDICGIKILSISPSNAVFSVSELLNMISAYITFSFTEEYYEPDPSTDTSMALLYGLLEQVEITVLYFNPFMADKCSGETKIKALELAHYIGDVIDYLRMRSEHMILKATSKRELINKQKFFEEYPEFSTITNKYTKSDFNEGDM